MPSPPSFPAAAIAKLLAAELVGDGSIVVSTIAPLDEAGPNALSWIGHPKYLPKLATTNAGVVLVPLGCDVPPGRTAIKVPDPDLALVALLGHVAPPLERLPDGIDPTARVSPKATVEGASIGPFVYVGDGAVVGAGTQLHAGVWIGRDAAVGRGCVLWPHAVVREHCRVGDRVVIHASATIGTDGFGYLQRDGRHVKIPQIGYVDIGDDVEIGAGVCIDRARSGVTRVGRGVKIDNLVQIGHNVSIGDHSVIVAQAGISGSTTVGRQVTIAGQAGLADHIAVGDGAVIAAQCGVTKDVPPGTTLIGSPGMERDDFVRSIGAGRQVERLKKQLKGLIERIERLESTADH